MTDSRSRPDLRDNAALSSTTLFYSLPQRFVYLELLVFLLIATLLIFAWLPAVLSIFRYGTILPSALRAAIFLNVTAFSLLIFHLFVRREMRRVQFILTDELLVHKTSLRIKKIPLAGIRSVVMIGFPVIGGVLIVNSVEGSITIPLILQKTGDLIFRFEGACRDMAAACSVPEATWRKIRLTGQLSESAGRRSSAVFKPLFITSVVVLPVSVFIGAVYWDMSIIPLMLWSVAGSTVPLCAYAASDIIIRLHEAGNGDGHATPNARIDEKRVYAWSGLLFLMIYLFAGIIFKAFML